MPEVVTIDKVMFELQRFEKDPYHFVKFAFPWEDPGELEAFKGPEPWQTDWLGELGRRLQAGDELIQLATGSGHGVGKSALVSWTVLWAMSTFVDTLGVVTANTETQLRTKTWVQLNKWFRLFIAGPAFDLRATGLFSLNTGHERTWRIDSVPWSEHNTEAFAGLHNQGKRILLVMDEASAIPDAIWETSEGALTDSNTQKIWAVFGNPTRNTGRFRDCFEGGRFAHRWSTRRVDSRQVSFTDKDQIARWISDYGDDSDFVRVRVKGTFPRTDSISFIQLDTALEATRRTMLPGQAGNGAVVLGVDVGRFGDDPSVIYPRKGHDAVSLPIEVIYGGSTMDTAGRVAAAMLRHNATVAFVDEGGVGGGVVDRLRQLNVPCVGIDFGSVPTNYSRNDGSRYANKRAEMWGALREALRIDLVIPERIQGYEVTLVDELTGPTYGLNVNEAILLESKKDMRRRGLKSPNVADALALTYAYPVVEAPLDLPTAGPPVDYNPYSAEWMKGMQG